MTELDPEQTELLEAAFAEIRKAYISAPNGSEVVMPLRKDRKGKLDRRTNISTRQEVEIAKDRGGE